MTELVIGRTRARRRRRPRPPKFTRWQKMKLAFDGVLLAVSLVIWVAAALPAMIFCAAGCVAGIHSTFLDALRPPWGGRVSGLLAVFLTGLGVILALGVLP